MKKIIFSFVGILMFMLTGCLKPGDNIQPYFVPALVAFDFTTFQLVLVTSSGIFIAPELQNYEVTDGDAVLAEFNINYSNQPYSDIFVASELNILGKINMTAAWRTTGGETDDFDTPVLFMSDTWYDAVVYDGIVVLFFLFNHNISPDQELDYQMTYDIDASEMIPTAYIRAKKVGQSLQPEQPVERIHAFNMTYLLSEMTYYEKNTFNIMYNKGGEEQDFEEWLGNPVRTE